MKRWKYHLGVILFFALAAGVVTYPLITSLGTLHGVSADSLLFLWQLQHNVEVFGNGFVGLWDSNIFYPNANTFLYSEHILGLSVLAWPIIAVSKNPILAYNLIVLGSFIVTGWAMVQLFRLWVKNLPAALVGSFLVTFAAYFAVHFYQLHIVFFACVPLILWSLFVWFRTGSAVTLAAFTLFVIFQVASSGNVSFMLIPLLVLVSACWIILEKRGRRFLRIRALALSWFAILASVVLFYLPYTTVPVQRDLAQLRAHSMSIRDYFMIHPLFFEWGWFESVESSERYFFLGFVAAAVIGVGFVMLYRRRASISLKERPELFLLAIFTLSALLFSFGTHIQWNNDPGIRGPYSLLYEFVPGFDGIRSLGRMSIFVLLGLVFFAIRGLAPWVQSLNVRVQRVLASVVMTLFTVEMFLLTPFLPLGVDHVPKLNELEPVYTWIRENADEEVMIELPVGKSPYLESRYVYASAYHKTRMMNGYSGYFPESFKEAARQMKNFPSSESIEFLKENNVTIVVIHADEVEYWEDMERAIRETSLREVFYEQDDYVFELQ